MPKSEKIRVMISSRCKASIPYKGKPVLLSELRKLVKKEIEALRCGLGRMRCVTAGSTKTVPVLH